MSLDAAIARIITEVRGLTPRRDPGQPFVCDEDATGAVVEIDKLVGQRDRVFELAVALPKDGGEAGATSGRLRVEVVLLLAYLARSDEGMLDRRIGEDVGQIQRHMFQPSVWDASVNTLEFRDATKEFFDVGGLEKGAAIASIFWDLTYIDEAL